MSLRRIATLLLLVIVASTGALAQYQAVRPRTANFPWNNYIPSRIANSFSSIIGNGGTLIPSSNTSLYYYGNEYNFTLPFNFYFLSTTYPAGYNLRASANGYMSFNGGTLQTSAYAYYGYYWISNFGGNSYGYYNKAILAFAKDIQTSGVSDGGIYTKLTGSAPNRQLTIEWRGQGYFYGGGPGNFQVRLSEANGNIEWFYGAESIVTGGLNSFYSGWIGIKNLGETYYTYSPSGPPTRGPEADRYLFFNDPNKSADTVAITGTALVSYNGTDPYYYTEYQAFITNPPTPHLHHVFPTVGFKASPVFDDVATDSIWLTPTVTANAYGVGATPTVNARFRNIGAGARQDIPVKADLYFNGSLLDSRTGTAFLTSTPQFGRVTHTFTPAFGPLGNTGIYEVRVFTQFGADQDRINDTLKTMFYISKANDLMPYEIIQPMSNAAPLFQKYPLGVSVPIEIRYLNIGTNAQTNARVGYRIYNEAGQLLSQDETTITGRWDPISFKDAAFSPWTPTTVGRYFIQAYTALANDEQPNNDVFPATGPGKPFDVLYEIETSSTAPGVFPTFPVPNSTLPDGKPANVSATFMNSGVSDVANVPARVQIRNSANTLVYDRTVIISDIVGDGGRTTVRFPDFVPNGSGRYCVTAWINYVAEPVRSNDTARWCFNVAARLNGTIRVGFGERFRTLEETRDSLMFYGVGSPVTFELVDDAYTVTSSEQTTASLDYRGRVVGLSAANPVVYRPIAGKTDVAITLKTASGIGIWYGQQDTSNASGYIIWDGGANKALRFILENTNTQTTSSAYNRAIVFYLGQGASNYTVKNVKIQPVTGTSTVYKPNALALPLPIFTQATQAFRFLPDVSTTQPSIAVSAGIMLRNSAPIDLATGRNPRNADTLPIQNNRFENNEIRGFGYGIASVGNGALFQVGSSRFTEYSNQNNVYTNNLMENLGRAGLAFVYEKNSEISDNTIRRVSNTTSMPHAVGIWATSGGNTLNNRGYNSDLRIVRNEISQIATTNGTGAAILIETNENQLNTPGNVVYRFPANQQTNMRVWNNSATSYNGPTTIGIGMVMDAASRADLVVGGNSISNNTIYSNSATPSTGGNSTEFGIVMQRAGGAVKNNIIALVSPTSNPVGVSYTAPSISSTLQSDYNLFWVPNGYVGQLTNLSTQGFLLPSMARQRTLNQWRSATGLDMNSVEGNIVPEFVSTTPGAEDLHIKPETIGSLANNRGVAISGLTDDIDRESRGAVVNRPYDIGADEFTGVMRNNDLTAETITGPSGYRAQTGQYSDAEYVMSEPTVALRALVRNIGGMPMLANTATMTVEYRNPTTGSWTQVRRSTVPVSADVASTRALDYGSFQPMTLRELGFTDAFYGMSPNVSPVYRFTVQTGTDDFAGNNTTTKEVRFYLLRSTREALVSLESYNAAGGDAVTLSNRLNSDSLMAALANINWQRSDGAGLEDFDLFERDKWPSANLDFRAWDLVIWSQGSEATGLLPEERAAIKGMLSMGNNFDRRNLILAGQDVARIHDVVLTASNGQIADRDFVQNVLRAQYLRGTVPADYSNKLIRGVTVTPGKFEELEPTGVAGDAPPMPVVVRPTTGQGIASLSHAYTQQTIAGDSGAGVTAAAPVYNSVYYGFDWRHAGRFNFELAQSGGRRLLLGALDFIDQYGGVLPINLVSFTAYQSGERAAKVDWVTARETEISSLEVERAEVMTSAAGETVGSFAVIDRVSPKGTATSGARYSVSDRSVVTGRTYIYRLVSVNLEGVRTSEEQARVEITGGTIAGYQVTVLPNPVRTTASVAYRAPRGERLDVELYNVEGELVATLATGLESAGEGEIAVDASGLASGSYTVRLRSGAAVVTTKLTVAK